MTAKRPYPGAITVVLIFISATFLFSCSGKQSDNDVNLDSLKTQVSVGLTTINSQNGVLSYRFDTPLMERYDMASVPFMEFPQGVRVETYNDSTKLKESELEADYAKYIEPQKLWEARGNVVAVNKDGDTLRTEQLFWDETKDLVYSNVTSTIVQNGLPKVVSWFESTSSLDSFRFGNLRGQLPFSVRAAEADSTATDTLLVNTDEAPALPE